MAVADVFDALISARVYKRPMSADRARNIILADAGSRFDPDVVRAFERSFGRLLAIAHRYRDDNVSADAARNDAAAVQVAAA